MLLSGISQSFLTLPLLLLTDRIIDVIVEYLVVKSRMYVRNLY